MGAMTELHSDRILGGLYGLLVGDAVGVPYEFSAPEQLPPLERIELPPPPEVTPCHEQAPPGAWSDDGAQALCLLESLLECGQLQLKDFGQRLVSWLTRGHLAVGGVVFDVGVQTRKALTSVQRGIPVERSGLSGERDNGNGSLMRVLPLALWHRGTDEQLAMDAARQSLPTHAHPRSQVACALYCLWARATLEGKDDTWERASATMRALCVDHPEWQTELRTVVRPGEPIRGSGGGYVLDCLHSARLALEEESFQRVIQRAVSLGDDTDTTAAVAGGIAGLRWGYSSIPTRWLAALAGRELVEPLAQRLLLRLQLA
jgi:ADP-ribosyl-[dinitrogen reductase] hydrolase